jgi:hypothetical protein
MYASLCNSLDGVAMPPDGLTQFTALANRHREERMMRYENSGFGRCHCRKAFPNHRDLVMIDPPVLDRQRSRGVDPEHCDVVIFEPRAEVIVDISFIPVERRSKTCEHVIQRHIMITGDLQNREARSAKPT